MKKYPENGPVLQAIANRRRRKERAVFTNGCFDLLHVGHLRYLSEARKLGDFLVVGLNSDDSVRRLKGLGRPILPAVERAELLEALRVVDYVVLFAEDTPEEIILQVEPDILVKGGDWPVENIVGADFVLSRGGKVLSLPFHQGQSTSSIIERIKSFAVTMS